MTTEEINIYLFESYTLTEAAKITGLTRQALSKAFKEGKLSGVKLGRDVRVSKDNLYRYFWNHTSISGLMHLLQVNGYGKISLDDLVKHLESLES